MQCLCCKNKIWIEDHHNDDIIQIMTKKGDGMLPTETGIEMSHKMAFDFAKEIIEKIQSIRMKHAEEEHKKFMERITYLECTSKTSNGITFGKIYEVTFADTKPSAKFGTQYRITNDCGEKKWYSFFSFKEVEKPVES